MRHLASILHVTILFLTGWVMISRAWRVLIVPRSLHGVGMYRASTAFSFGRTTASSMAFAVMTIPTRAFASGTAVGAAATTAAATSDRMNSVRYPVVGDDGLMREKSHGTSEHSAQKNLRWNCDSELADRICNYNRHYAEHSGFFTTHETNFLEYVHAAAKANDGPITFYDSVTGKPLFIAPVGRSYEEFLKESKAHGWPSFRDAEVVWENVRTLRNGEAVSITGTHLGHNLPDYKGNRYCINLVSVAGNPTDTEQQL